MTGQGPAVSGLMPPLGAVPRTRRVISLTPLIDVVFILLVFFMLASSFQDWRAIDLGAAKTGASPARTERPILIELGGNDVRIDGRRAPAGDAAAIVREMKEKAPGREILLRPAAGVAVQPVIDLLDALNRAGMTGVALVEDGG